MIDSSDGQNTSDSGRHRRSAKRRRILKGGWLVIADGTSSIRCFVKDISSTGARVETEAAANTPDGLLRLTLSDGETLEAEVVRRTGLELGIRFVNDQRPSLAPSRNPLEDLVTNMADMSMDEILDRVDALNLDKEKDVGVAAEAFDRAFSDLYHALSKRATGPW
ncbi:PilZ domain-containing protein [Rhodospira trueperi]|uniref:PilZ domain-containing protein n=1 Tax=Rhodospira trueperi TaxID=69960 RepID=A0A1G7E5X0_9PROT|nr:PilZ domain-containing protein [Rhodospira trueperi]SDE59128.1 PilZ domain-containing protein [Rhodospira trueperi]